MHRWGYAPTVKTLAEELIGGAAPPERLADALGASGRVIHRDGFVCIPGQDGLIEKSRVRVRTDRLVNGEARSIAEDFARGLARACPFVDCIALSGSVSSGGYVPSDDIDLDLFVPDGAKYLTYAVALALGLRFALRHRGLGPFRKIICINVVWTRAQTTPFVRNDVALAFELLHCRPIVGAAHFREVIERNGWIAAYFPQVAMASSNELPWPRPSSPGRILDWIASHRRLLAVADRVCRIASFVVYATAHWLRRHDAEARERLEFLQRAKYPYEVFQD